MMIHRVSILFAIAVAAILTGCAEKVTMREGQSLHLIPVSKAWSSVINSSNAQKVKSDLFELADKNLQQIAQKGVVVAYSAKGQTLATELNRWLVAQGVASKKIILTNVTSLGVYDIQIQFHEYQVVTESCSPTQIGTYGFNEDGCYAENARWQSMVNPNAMLKPHSNQ